MSRLVHLLKILIFLAFLSLSRAYPKCDGTDCKHLQDAYNDCHQSVFSDCTKWVHSTNPSYVENAESFCSQESSRNCKYLRVQLDGCRKEVERSCPKPTTTTTTTKTTAIKHVPNPKAETSENHIEELCKRFATDRCHHLSYSLDKYVECWKKELKSCFDAVTYTRTEGLICREVDRHFDVCITPMLCRLVIYPIIECGL